MASPTAHRSILHDRPYPPEHRNAPGTAVWPPDRATFPENSGVSLDVYVDLLRRRKNIVIFTFLLVFVLGVFATRATTPTYRVATRILLEGPEIGMFDDTVPDPLSHLFLPEIGHDVATQIQVLQSTQVLADAYQEVGVPANAVQLDFKQVGVTDIIEISAQSTAPEMAAQIVRQMPITFRTYLTGHHKAELHEALTSSQEKLRREQTRLRQAEQALQQFKSGRDVPNLDAIRDRKIAQQGTNQADLYKAEVNVATAEAKLESALDTRRRQPDFIESMSTTISQVARGPVNEDIARLELQRQQALNLYQPDQFQVRRLDTLIDQEQKRLERTPDRQVSVLRTSNPDLAYYDDRIADAHGALTAALAARTQARHALAVSSAALVKFNAMETRLMDLQRELKVRNDNVAALTRTVDLLDLRDRAGHNPVTVITAPSPAEQIEPKVLTNLGYSAAVGLILAVAMGLFQEFMDDRLTSPEEVRDLLKTPMLGYVPMIDKDETHLLHEQLSSSFVLESYRVLRANVQFAAAGAGARSLLVTSTIPDEGKSLTAANLAVAMALDGRRVILVDTDLRRPSLHTKFNTSQSPGLTNVLVGHTGLRAALRPTGLPNLLLLTTGPLPPNPAELLHSKPMAQIHEQLKAWADVVIFDSPPYLSAADAQVMAATADGVLYVVQFGETRRSGLRHALDLLEQANAPILGVIFNKIDVDEGRNLYEAGYFNYYLTAQGDLARHSRAEFEALLSRREPANSGSGGDAKRQDHRVSKDGTEPEEDTEVPASAAEEGMPV